MIYYSFERWEWLGIGNCLAHDCSTNWDIGKMTSTEVQSEVLRERTLNTQIVGWLLYECVLRSQAVRRFIIEGAMHVMRLITMKVPLVISPELYQTGAKAPRG
ncbi:MAG TPA: hypothetical protein VEL49_08675 [Ktedonobacteraceae bacterium]|nr:hypothetical protein [Ktedonobacteraceae bacterium]